MCASFCVQRKPDEKIIFLRNLLIFVYIQKWAKKTYRKEISKLKLMLLMFVLFMSLLWLGVHNGPKNIF